MEDNNLKNQFSADLLEAVSNVLSEQKVKLSYEKKMGSHNVNKNGSFHRSFPTEYDAQKYVTKNQGKTHDELAKIDEEVEQVDEKRGLWDNIHAKRKRIKSGSGERMRKPGSEGAPTAADLKNSQNEEVSLDEKHGGADYAIYHKSYTDAVDHALSHHGKSGLSVSDDDRFHHIGLMSKKPSEGNTTTLNLPAKDHTTGKEHTIHMQVYNRGGSHPYELNTYSSKNSSQRQIDKVAAKRKKALGEALIGGQAKLDVDKDGKLEKSDFKKLRNKKIAAKVKEAKDCACDDMDEAVYNGHRPTGLHGSNPLPKDAMDKVKAKLDAYDKKMDDSRKKFAKEDTEQVDEIFSGISMKMLPNKRKGPNPYDGAKLPKGKSLGAALKHLDDYKKANPEKFATKEEVELDEVKRPDFDQIANRERPFVKNENPVRKVADKKPVSHTELAQLAHKAYVQATRLGNGTMAAHYLQQHKKHKGLAEKERLNTLKDKADIKARNVKEEVELDEGRGRPPKPGSAAYIAQQKAKEAGEAEGPEPDEHIMNQVRKAADSGMIPHKIKYADGSTHALHRVHARAVIAKYNRLKPFAKEDMQAEIAKSHEHMMKHAKD